jgi:hypothetical protein
MTERIDFGFGVTVEHIDNDTSYVYDKGNALLFQGESAWSNAERFAYDLTVSRQYA